jgi:hypothetical protein
METRFSCYVERIYENSDAILAVDVGRGVGQINLEGSEVLEIPAAFVKHR